MKSIRLYLIIAILAAVTLGNFVAATYGYRKSSEEAEALLDTQLSDTAALIHTMRPARESVSLPPSDRLAFQIWTADGVLVQRSANSGLEPITRFEEGYRDENFEEYRWRVLSRFDQRSGLWLQVAERIDIRIELADNIILRALLPIVLSLPLIAAIVWLVVGNGLSLIGKLANADKTFELMVYPRTRHGVRRSKFALHFHRMKVEFLKRYLLDDREDHENHGSDTRE